MGLERKKPTYNYQSHYRVIVNRETLVSGFCVVNPKFATLKVMSIEIVDGRLALLLGSIFAEAHASWSASFAVLKNAEFDNLSETSEEVI